MFCCQNEKLNFVLSTNFVLHVHCIDQTCLVLVDEHTLVHVRCIYTYYTGMFSVLTMSVF